MKAQHGAGALALMHAIKQALDPENIMNSGEDAAAIVIEPSCPRSKYLCMFKTFTTYWRSHIMPSPAALALVSVGGGIHHTGIGMQYVYSLSAEHPHGWAGTFYLCLGWHCQWWRFVVDRRPWRGDLLPRLMIGGSALIILLSGILTSLAMGLDAGVPSPPPQVCFSCYLSRLGIAAWGCPVLHLEGIA